MRKALLIVSFVWMLCAVLIESSTGDDTRDNSKAAPEDGEKLLHYLRKLLASDVDPQRINSIIAQFGADDFDVRLKASEDIERFGPTAVGPLKKAEEGPDPEIAHRASVALKRLAKERDSVVSVSAIRSLGKLKRPGAAATLIEFLPMAENEAVADAIREALIDLAENEGKAEPALVAALKDKSSIRRAAAYVALTKGGATHERIRIKDSYPVLKAAVLRDEDLDARFVGLWSLALVTREKEFIPELIKLIPKLPRGQIWQVEDFLLQIAGTHPKNGRFLASSDDLLKASEAWAGWWKENGATIDLGKINYKPRILGITDVIELDIQYARGARLLSYRADFQERLRITNLKYPTDMKIGPNGNVWVVECNIGRITERNKTGSIVGTARNVGPQPINFDLLPDGGLMVVTRSKVTELDKNDNSIWTYTHKQSNIVAGRRLPSGNTLILTGAPAGRNYVLLDKKGQEIPREGGKAIAFGQLRGPNQSIDVIDADKVLVCELDKVAEYDMKTGKQIWKHDCPPNSTPISCQRLPNGNTLITLLSQNTVIEVVPSGEVVWEYQAKDGMAVSRAFRR